MCYVLIGAAISAAAAIGAAAQQADNQRRQVNYQNRLADVTSANAADAAEADYVAAAERVSQVRQSAAQEAFEASREAGRAVASLEVGAEFAGLSGGVVDDIRKSIAIQAAEDAALRERNASWQEQQVLRSVVNIQAQQRSRLNSAIPSPVPGIDYGSLIGGLGSAITTGAQDRNINRGY